MSSASDPSRRDVGSAVGPRPATDAQNTLVGLRDRVRAELQGVIVGYEQPLDLLLVATIAGGHVLLEGPPGVAKTLMSGAIARVLGVSFRRVQFTPDTTPQEVIGHNVTRAGKQTFMPGAAFSNILLADEVNRTPPRTQAALLEAMQERHVTVDGRTHWLPTPFMVVATQNPFEQEGIFPLPESQLDRFIFKVRLDYGSAADEEAILRLPHRGLAPDVLGEIQPLLDVAQLDGAQREIDATPVSADAARFIVAVVRATREIPGIVLGASPRAAIHLLAAAKAHARLGDRPTVTREDVAEMVPFALTHRLLVKGVAPEEIIGEALVRASSVPRALG